MKIVQCDVTPPFDLAFMRVAAALPVIAVYNVDCWS
jgi:hypothetical protein